MDTGYARRTAFAARPLSSSGEEASQGPG
jgi:hypothetical protein